MEPLQKHKTSASIEFIRSYFLEKKKINPHYTVPAFARDLGVSKSYLWRLLNGDRPLTVKQAIQMAAVLGLSAKKTDDLVARLVLESGKNAKISKAFRQKIANRDSVADSITHYDIERFKAVSNWYHLAILNLVKLKNFKSSPAWIAGRLGISKLEAVDAIDRLKTLGLLKSKAGVLQRTHAHLSIEGMKPGLATAHYLDQTFEKARTEIKDHSDEAFKKRFMCGITLPVDEEKIEQLKSRLEEVRLELMTPVQSANLTEVYQINIQLFPLTKKEV